MKLRALGLLCILMMPAVARAQPTGGDAPSGTGTAQQQAAEHFKRVKVLYSQGRYKEALVELEAAHALDPSAKILVYNLGLLNEKLGDIDSSLKWFREYQKMDLTAEERAECDSNLRRLEGAKKDLDARQAEHDRLLQQQQQQADQDHAPTPPPGAPPREMGRIDAATITAGSLALMGLGIGIGFGVKAIGDQPKAGFTTNGAHPLSGYQDQQNTAHREAVIADIGFGVGIAGAIVTGVLYFARPKVSASAPTTGQRVGFTVVGNGGAVTYGGSF